MATIIINDEMRAKGKLSISRAPNEDRTGFIVTGAFATHMYYENIISLESPRYRVSGIDVFEESFGSDDYDIIYRFVAKNFTLKDVMSDGVGFILYENEMNMIEDEMYKHDHPILGGIGEEYKDMYEEGDDDVNE